MKLMTNPNDESMMVYAPPQYVAHPVMPMGAGLPQTPITGGYMAPQMG